MATLVYLWFNYGYCGFSKTSMFYLQFYHGFYSLTMVTGLPTVVPRLVWFYHGYYGLNMVVHIFFMFIFIIKTYSLLHMFMYIY